MADRRYHISELWRMSRDRYRNAWLAARRDRARLRAQLAAAQAERNCYAMAVQYALNRARDTSPYELRQGIQGILATMPAAVPVSCTCDRSEGDHTPHCAAYVPARLAFARTEEAGRG